MIKEILSKVIPSHLKVIHELSKTIEQESQATVRSIKINGVILDEKHFRKSLNSVFAAHNDAKHS